MTDYVATRWYRSPELLLTPQYGKSVDIWALGCVIGEMISGDPIFPGDNMLDQLDEIYKHLGKLPDSYMYLLAENKETCRLDFNGYLSNPEGFRKDFIKNHFFKFCKNADLIDLLEKMLDLDFNKRITASDAMNHPFFHDLLEYKENVPKGIDLKASTDPLKESSIKKSLPLNSNNMKNQTQFLNLQEDGSKTIAKINIKN